MPCDQRMKLHDNTSCFRVCSPLEKSIVKSAEEIQGDSPLKDFNFSHYTFNTLIHHDMLAKPLAGCSAHQNHWVATDKAYTTPNRVLRKNSKTGHFTPHILGYIEPKGEIRKDTCLDIRQLINKWFINLELLYLE